MGKDNQTSQLRLLLLGSPRVELTGTPLEISRRKAIALLVYLAVTGEIHQRESLATLLWPDYDESKAHAYLRRTLWSLKKALGDEWLITERERIGLVHNEGVWLDVARFRQLLSETQAHGHPADEVCTDCLPLLIEAVDLYRGDFLAGFTLPDAPEFDEWQFFQAEGLRQKLALALERLTQGYSTQGDFDIAIPPARRWLNLDPEPAHSPDWSKGAGEQRSRGAGGNRNGGDDFSPAPPPLLSSAQLACTANLFYRAGKRGGGNWPVTS